MSAEQEEEMRAMARIKDKKVHLLDTANFAIKKSVLRDLGYTNPNVPIGHDVELELRLKIKGYDIYFKRVAILHSYADTALKVFKKLLNYGMWNAIIRKMHETHKELFPFQSKADHLRYFIGISSELLRLHKNFRYDLVAGMGWRTGLVCGYWLRKIILKTST